MKKSMVAALTAAMVMGAASTTFAAANPFSDVPAGHWAYDAVSQLAQDGIIDGYGDQTFQGDKNITRYEMAQMVAKAMAKANSGAKVSGADKAALDKLAAEFSDELNNLGVRVANLEKNADKVAWHGTAEYTFQHYINKDSSEDKFDSRNNLLLRLLPDAEVNDNWHVKARLDANTALDTDTGADGKVNLERVWAEGHYGQMRYMAGKYEFPDPDTITDTVLSGVEVGYLPAKGWNAQVGAGRFNLGDHYTSTKDTAADTQYLHVGYNQGKFSAAGAYYHLGADHMDNYFQAGSYAKGTTDDANIWTGKGSYQFDKNWGLKGFYAENTEADYYQKAGSVELNYKGSQLQNAGTYGVWVAYRHFGRNAFVSSPWDVINLDRNGEKGWELGGNFVPFKNTIVTLRYGDGEYLDTGKDVHNMFGRVNFLF
ncbi:MAG: S-layer homology domain-containing protein [Selenomonas sp.]|nr:S-layer homology domain-containing protein [Selenomonas sp.]